ncbi:TPA: restriction endonuclease subunit S [Pseudomonas aeruginosa]
MNAQVKPGYKQTEIGVIPEDWSAATVGEYFDIQLGKMLDAEKNTGVYKPYLGNRAVQWGRINISDLPTMAMSTADIARYRLKHGDLLVCEGGEVGRAAIWESPIAECYYQKALHRLRPIREFNTVLMQALLQYWVNENLLSNFVTQTSIAHFPKEKFQIVPLPVPPAKEQEAIASALSDMDALISSLDRLIAKKRDIQQATMQQLLSGQRRLPGFSGEWEVKRLGELVTFMKGQGLSKNDLVVDGARPCIHYGELFTHYSVTIQEVKSRTNNELAGCLSKENDVLMPTSDVTPRGLAKASCISVNDVVLGGDILVIRPNLNSVNGSFLSYVIRHDEDQVLKLVSGSTVFHLYGADMKKFEFMTPPIEEQNAITATLSDMDNELAALETRRSKAQQLKQGMMQELLTGRIRLV